MVGAIDGRDVRYAHDWTTHNPTRTHAQSNQKKRNETALYRAHVSRLKTSTVQRVVAV
jgi:hypothetical protein